MLELTHVWTHTERAWCMDVFSCTQRYKCTYKCTTNKSYRNTQPVSSRKTIQIDYISLLIQRGRERESEKHKHTCMHVYTQPEIDLRSWFPVFLTFSRVSCLPHSLVLLREFPCKQYKSKQYKKNVFTKLLCMSCALKLDIFSGSVELIN